jgi:hypothetical protein
MAANAEHLKALVRARAEANDDLQCTASCCLALQEPERA